MKKKLNSIVALLFTTFLYLLIMTSLESTTPTVAQLSNQTHNTNNATNSVPADGTNSTMPIPEVQTDNAASQDAFRTFHVQGTLDSAIITGERIPAPNSTASNPNATIEHPPYLISGRWDLRVLNGTLQNVSINFTMVHIDGYERHTHNITNFSTVGSVSSKNSTELKDGYVFLEGIANILENNTLAWTAVPMEFRIEHYNVMNVTIDNSLTENHFYNQPLYGVVQTLEDGIGRRLKV